MEMLQEFQISFFFVVEQKRKLQETAVKSSESAASRSLLANTVIWFVPL